ncbi:hypothetical protein B4073_0847 [Bacillus subtilis]|nr:hypothetical protein B4068_0859 [Bacillus subtilis]KIN56078.1 hypothetical protein B4073_0847 [Bacillus subtilis]POD83838.1 hypothetical protein S101384_03824 [Bacillus subtilis subsp. subtilis]
MGNVHVKGVKIAQEIRSIDVLLNTRYVIVKDGEEQHITLPFSPT